MTKENLIKSKQVFSKDELSFIISCLLGDGHLSDRGCLNIRHGKPQRDYIEWKSKRLSEIIKQDVKALPTTKCYQIQVTRKNLRDLRYKIYPNNQKSLVQILEFISNPLEAVAIWLMDDGNVSPSMSNNGKCYSSAFQVFTFCSLEEGQGIIEWFKNNVGISPALLFRDRAKSNKKSGYILKFNAKDSRELYKLIKHYIPQIDSMIYKFRYIEHNVSTRPLEEILKNSSKDSLNFTVM